MTSSGHIENRFTFMNRDMPISGSVVDIIESFIVVYNYFHTTWQQDYVKREKCWWKMSD